MLIRTSPPAFSQNFSFELPTAEVTALSNGVNLFLLRGIQQNVFKIEFIFAAGKWHEPLKGLSHFLAIMLDKGTTTLSSKQIAEAFDFYGAQLEIVPGYDATSVNIYGLNRCLKKVLPIAIDLLINANFPMSELELQKEIFIQNLKVNNKKTSYVASKLLRQSIFGADHPYGSSVEETDVAGLSTEVLQGFFEQNFALENIFMVGNLDSEDDRWLKNMLCKVRVKRKTIPPSIQIQNTETRTERAISEGVQASLRLGKRFINRDHVDYPAALLLNQILGGYFGSRLMKNIREEKGLTYGIYSSIQPLKSDSFFSIGADVNADNIEIALSEIEIEINNLVQKSISESELAVAKNHFLGSQQTEASNPFTAIDRIKVIESNHLPQEYYSFLFRQIQDTAVDNIQSTAAKYLNKELASVVVK